MHHSGGPSAVLRRRSVHRYPLHTARRRDAAAASRPPPDLVVDALAAEQTSAFHPAHAEPATIAASTTLFSASASSPNLRRPAALAKGEATPPHLNCHFTAGLISVCRRKFFSGRSHLATLRNRNTGSDRFITTISIASSERKECRIECGVPPSKNSFCIPIAISCSIRYERITVPTEYFPSPPRFICQSTSVTP